VINRTGDKQRSKRSGPCVSRLKKVKNLTGGDERRGNPKGKNGPEVATKKKIKGEPEPWDGNQKDAGNPGGKSPGLGGEIERRKSRVKTRKLNNMARRWERWGGENRGDRSSRRTEEQARGGCELVIKEGKRT